MSGDDAATRFTDLGGATFFFRCGVCRELYEPTEGINWSAGTKAVYWMRPQVLRKAGSCKHRGPVERWDGKAWVPVTIRDAQAPAVEAILPDSPSGEDGEGGA